MTGSTQPGRSTNPKGDAMSDVCRTPLAKLKRYWPGADLVFALVAFASAIRGTLIGNDIQFFGWCTLGFLLLILAKLEGESPTITVNVRRSNDDR
jgi:hypothetical protein